MKNQESAWTGRWLSDQELGFQMALSLHWKRCSPGK